MLGLGRTAEPCRPLFEGLDDVIIDVPHDELAHGLSLLITGQR